MLQEMPMLQNILLILLILFIFGGIGTLPNWSHSRSWDMVRAEVLVFLRHHSGRTDSFDHGPAIGILFPLVLIIATVISCSS